MFDKLDSAAKISEIFSKAIDILFLKNPVKNALGFLLGVFMQGVLNVILATWFNNFTLPWYVYITGGILLMNRKSIAKPYQENENIETAIHYMEELQKKGNFSEREKRQQWRRLVEQVYLKVNQSDGNNDSANNTTDENSSQHNDLTPAG